MTPLSLVAAALQNRAAFESIKESGEAAVLPEELISSWHAIERFYETDPAAKRADPEVVTAYAIEGLSNPKHQQAIAGIVRRLAEVEASGANISAMLRMVGRTRCGDSLAQALASRKSPDTVRALIQEYERLSEDSPNETESGEIDWRAILAERLNPEGRLKVAPKALNEFLGGGLLPGHNVTLFARPEAGKTALAVTMACGFARRGHRVLYVINEDPVKDLMVRALSCATGRGRDAILADTDGTIALGLKRGLGNLSMRELSPGSMGEVEQLVKLHKPAVLIVDQIRNMRIAKQDNYTQGLDHIAQGLRALGKKHGLVTIGTTQAGDSASNRPVLEMGDIDSSNTGIPGAADVLIGMGITDTLRNAGQRVLSISKNKVSGRHGYFTVRIDEQTSRIASHE